MAGVAKHEQKPKKAEIIQFPTPLEFAAEKAAEKLEREQAEQMFVALLERGVPTRLLVNKRCFHGGRRVSQLLHDVDAMLAWFGRYPGGEGA